MGASAGTAAEATAALADLPPTALRRSLLEWGATLVPFWLTAVDVIALHDGYPGHLHQRYRQAAAGAVDVMEAGLEGRKLLKKQTGAVDSAISALTHGLIRSSATDHAFAPSSDHAASVLRTCLRVTTRSYDDEQVPDLVTSALMHLAAVRTGFPLSCYTLWSTPDLDPVAGRARAESRGEPEDLYRVTAGHLGFAAQAEVLLHEARHLWSLFPGPPPPVHLPADVWTATADGAPCPSCGTRTGRG